MSEKQIPTKDQKCISECIVKHWSQHSRTSPDLREQAYINCLDRCEVCS